MAAVVTDVTTYFTAPVNRVMATDFLRQLAPFCPYFAGVKAGSLQSHQGSFTLLWYRYDELSPSTTALSEKTGAAAYPVRSEVSLSRSVVTATVAKYGQHAVLTEEADLINPAGQEFELNKVMAISGGRSLNRLQRDIGEDGTTLIYASQALVDANVANEISAGLIQQAINKLARNSAMPYTAMSQGSQNIGTAPILPGFYGQCHSDVAADIARITGFKGVETYAGQVAIMPGEFGCLSIAGLSVRFMQSPEATVDTNVGGNPTSTLRSTAGNQADLYTTLVYGEESLGGISLDVVVPDAPYVAGDDLAALELIYMPLGSAGASDPFKEYATYGYKCRHAGAVLNTNWARGIRTAATVLQ